MSKLLNIIKSDYLIQAENRKSGVTESLVTPLNNYLSKKSSVKYIFFFGMENSLPLR